MRREGALDQSDPEQPADIEAITQKVQRISTVLKRLRDDAAQAIVAHRAAAAETALAYANA